jgi:hypothetical protein
MANLKLRSLKIAPFKDFDKETVLHIDGRLVGKKLNGSTVRIFKNGDYVRRTKKHTAFFDEEGRYHRKGGPAVLSTGTTYLPNTTNKWYRHGKLHRVNGPAVISSKYKQWWIFGIKIKEKRLG